MAASQLGSFSYDMLLNIAKFEDGLTRAQHLADQSAGKIQQSLQGMADGVIGGLEKIGAVLAAGFSVDKFVQLGASALQSAEQVDHMAQSLGASTQTIQTLSFAAGLSGSQLDLMTGALEKLERTGEIAAAGGKQQAEAFRAIGISASQLGVLLKDPDQLIQVVTQHLSDFKDGAAKTAVIIELMGRGAAQNTPLINKLGESFGALKDQATQLGVVLSDQDTRALSDAQGGIHLLGQEVQGLANQFVIALLPTITQVSHDFSAWMQSDSVKTGLKEVAVDIAALVAVLEEVPADVRATSAEFDTLAKSILGVDDATEKFLSLAPRVKNDSSGLFDFGGKDGLLPGVQSARDFLARINSAGLGSDLADKTLQSQAAPNSGVNFAKQLGADMQAAIPNIDNFGAHIDIVAGKVSEAGQKEIDYNAKIGATKDTFTKVTQESQKFLDSLAGFGADKYTKVWTEYNAKIQQTDLLYAKLLASGVSLTEAQKFLAAALGLVNDGFDAQVQAMRNANDADAILSTAYAKSESDLNEQIRLLGEDEQSREADTLATKLITQALGDLKDFMGPLTQAQQDVIDKNTALANSFVAQKTAVDNAKAVMKEWQGIATQGFDSVGKTIADFATGGIKKWSDFGKALVTDAKQFIAQIIEEFLKLNFFNGIINNLFNLTGTSALATAGGGLFSAAVGGGSAVSSLLNWTTGADGTSPAGSTTNGGLFGTAEGGVSLFNAGKSIWDGFSNGFSTFFGANGSQSMLGSLTGTGEFDFGGSTAGTIGSVAGGAIAGYQIGSQIGGKTGGIIGAAGLGVAAYFVPVIGWIAGAAALINQLTGGGLFGTKGSFNFGQTALTVGAGGAVATAGFDTKGKSPLFGGSTHSWTSVDPGQAAVDAANQFYTQLLNGTEAFATSFGTKAGAIIGGQFLQNYDKKGNPTTSSDTVLGKAYTDTAQQFAERLQAENELAVLDTFDSKLNASIDQYRANADQLIAITSALANGETMMKAGTSFLALGTDQSLSSLLKLAQGSQAFGESIDQTLARIEQAQAAYDQFVGQFKPAANYVDDFEKALSGINAQMVANVKQANALAVAAGAQGAAEKDLANIHKYAAAQVQLAITALEQSAQALAFSMGLSTVGTLDQVNSEIQQLESQAKSGASGIQNFGNAITQVSQKATQAMNLLLGDLSPLNDQQKLQDALQGLRAGTATQEEVLQIGRRLYASSQAYTDLFNMVKNMGHAAATGGGGGGVAVGGLSASDQQKLAELLKEQTQLQAAADYTNAQTLAQQIAEIAAAKSEDYKKVATDMHIDLGALEKKLGLNDDSFAKLIASDQAAKDSNGDNTTSIVDVLNKILLALGGTPDAGTPAGGAPPSTPPGHAGPRSGMTVQQFVDQVVGGLINRGPRNMRQQRA